MNNVPEDSILKRHYITELTTKQRLIFDSMLQDAGYNQVAQEPPRMSSLQVIIPLMGFLLVLSLFLL